MGKICALILALTSIAQAQADFTILATEPRVSGVTFPSGAVAVWKMDESSGNLVPAIGGLASCTLTNIDISGPVGFSAGKINNCPDFVAASFDYFQTATNSTELDLGGGNYTIDLWVNPTAASADGFVYYLAKESVLSTDTTYAIRSAGDSNIYFYHFATSTPDIYTTPARSILPGVWTHFAATYDGANVVLYTNGVAATTTAQTSDIRVLNTSPLAVGYNTGTGGFYGGLIDELGIWKRALSASEILTGRYNGGVGLQP